MIEVELVEAHNKIRKDLKKASVAYYFMETMGRITQDEEKNPDLYDLLIEYLIKLEKSKSLKILRQQYVYDVLVLIGFWPQGKKMDNPDTVLENVLEKKLTTARVGKKMLE